MGLDGDLLSLVRGLRGVYNDATETFEAHYRNWRLPVATETAQVIRSFGAAVMGESVYIRASILQVSELVAISHRVFCLHTCFRTSSRILWESSARPDHGTQRAGSVTVHFIPPESLAKDNSHELAVLQQATLQIKVGMPNHEKALMDPLASVYDTYRKVVCEVYGTNSSHREHRVEVQTAVIGGILRLRGARID